MHDDIRAEAEFLCARLRELEGDLVDGDTANDFYGHVVPPLARLESLLSRTLPPANTEADVERVARALEECWHRLRENDLREVVWPAMARAALSPRPAGGEEVELRREIEILRRALVWHGDPARMATTREAWQQTVDAAVVWVQDNPEPGYPPRPTFAAAALTKPPALPKEGEGEEAGLTDAYKSMTPLEKWETLVLNGLIGTDEPWIEDMRQSLKALASREQGPPCENCLRPVEVGQVVLPWEEPGEMHADCEHPFSLKVTRHEGEPAPVVLLGEPMVHVALSSLPVRSGEDATACLERIRDRLEHSVSISAAADIQGMVQEHFAALATPQQVKEDGR